jgi:tRNA (guanine-N7-)-methyltransferase
MACGLLMRQANTKSRPVRSFVRREGRMTTAQKRALADLWATYGIDDDATPVDEHLFGDPRNLTLEIGFGDGDTLVTMASEEPEAGFIGIDPHRPGAGRTLLQLERASIDNVRVIIGDGAQLLPQLITSASLTRVLVLFPDPWPKKRHHKRRLLNVGFLQMISDKLKPTGTLHIATDWAEYAKEILIAIESAPGLVNATGAGQFAIKPNWRPTTKYERRGLKLGHRVFDIAAVRK